MKRIVLFIIIYFVIECLEHIASMIENYGTSIFHPSITVVLREIAKSISDRDNSARMSALNCFVAVHLLLGDALFKLVGNVIICYLIYELYFMKCYIILIILSILEIYTT